MKRLSNQWKNSYGEERKARIWQVFKDLPDEIFTQVVDTAIDEWRSPPLVADLSKIEAQVRERGAQQRAYAGLAQASIAGTLARAESNNKSANPEFVKACMNLVRERYAKKIPEGQYLEACDALDSLANTINPQRKAYPGKRDYGRED